MEKDDRCASISSAVTRILKDHFSKLTLEERKERMLKMSMLEPLLQDPDRMDYSDPNLPFQKTIVETFTPIEESEIKEEYKKYMGRAKFDTEIADLFCEVLAKEFNSPELKIVSPLVWLANVAHVGLDLSFKYPIYDAQKTEWIHIGVNDDDHFFSMHVDFSNSRIYIMDSLFEGLSKTHRIHVYLLNARYLLLKQIQENKIFLDIFVLVSLSDIRKEVQCPICLGIIRKTRTVMECLHRFCRECIDKSIRMGNKECPACRTHCPSRRSLRDDANFDALIAAIFPDIDQYEEEELLFQEDEEARNKQVRLCLLDSIGNILMQTRQAIKSDIFSADSSFNRPNIATADRGTDQEAEKVKEYISKEKKLQVCTEDKSRRSKRWRGWPSPASASGDGGDNEHDQQAQKEPLLASVGLVGCSEMLAWGKGGLRSNFRYSSGKHSRNRLTKLSEHLRNLHENDSEREIQVVLIPLDQQKPSALQHSFLCSRPTLSVEQLCQFIAVQTSLAPERLEILAARGPSSKSRSFAPVQGQVSSLCALEACIDDLRVLDSEETLVGLRASCNFNQGHLRLAYRQKAST